MPIEAARSTRPTTSTGWRSSICAALTRGPYYPITFTDSQWQQLQAAFPTGVCDWTKPGIDQQGANPWQTYQDGSGNVVYGGQPLGAAPAGSGGGWTSNPFSSWLG
jgi:Tannase-like family of unknown function (DUF6351)